MLRCPYCHDDLSAAEHLACGRCQARHHLVCFVENGGCAVMGCHASTPARRVQVRATAAPSPPGLGRLRSALCFACYVLPGIGALAFATAAYLRTPDLPEPPPPVSSSMRFIVENEKMATPPPRAVAPIPMSVDVPTLSTDEKRANALRAIETLARALWADGVNIDGVGFTSSGYTFQLFHMKGGDFFLSAVPLLPAQTGDFEFEANESGITWRRVQVLPRSGK